jgi:DNA-binding protein YbaB
MFGKLGDMKDMLGKLQEAQKESQAMKQRLAQIELKEESEGLSVIVNGNKEIKDILIAEDLLKDGEELGDKLVLLINRALEKAQAVNDREMQSMATSMFK